MTRLQIENITYKGRNKLMDGGFCGLNINFDIVFAFDCTVWLTQLSMGFGLNLLTSILID